MIKLIAINTSYSQSMLAPYYIKANSGDIASEIEIIQTSTKVSIVDIISLIGDADIIGFSCYIFNINQVRQVASIIKKTHPNIIIIYGGPEIEDVQSACYSEADYVMIGEGDMAFASLVRSIRCGTASSRVIKAPMPNLNMIATPYDLYINDVGGKIAYFESSRGCPYSCAYCMSGKSRLRNFPLDYVYNELDKFKGAQIKVLKFVDRTFNADSRRAVEIMQYIISNAADYDFTFHYEIAADILTEEFMTLVESAPQGLFQYEIGVQSFNADTLNAVIRKCDLSKVKVNIARLAASGNCHIHTDLIAGLPYEDLASFAMSFDELYSLGGDMLQVGTLKLLHGSKLAEMVSSDSMWVFDSSAPYEVVATPYMTSNDIMQVKLLDRAVDKVHNGGRFKSTISRFVQYSPYDFYIGLATSCDIMSRDINLEDCLYNYLIQLGNEPNIVQAYMVRDYIEYNRALPKSGRIANVYDCNFKQLLAKYVYKRKSAYEFKLSYNPYAECYEDIIIVGYHQFSDDFYHIILKCDAALTSNN